MAYTFCVEQSVAAARAYRQVGWLIDADFERDAFFRNKSVLAVLLARDVDELVAGLVIHELSSKSLMQAYSV